MKTLDLFEETYLALSANKARSALTILGIVIGIASVIAMIAIGQGAQSSIQSSIQSAGANLLTVYPGAQRGIGMQVSTGRGSAQTLTQADADAIRSASPFIKDVAPELSRRYQVTTKGKNTNTQIIGTTPSYPDVRNIAIEQGSFISEHDTKNSNKVAVIGPTVRDDLFGEGANAIGSSLRINNIEFRVIGVTRAKGGSGFSNPDDSIYVPISTAQRFLAGDTYVSSISVQCSNQDSMTQAKEAITDLLFSRHHITNPQLADFNILNQADIVATASSVTGTFTTLLASIAAISLLVGGIGIMNMMLTNVTERTKEIGLRKAIGAYREEISRQFLMEAIALTSLGGIFGILFGWMISVAISRFAGYATAISPMSVLLALSVSAGIGILFGYYPARRAARLNPIDALKYE